MQLVYVNLDWNMFLILSSIKEKKVFSFNMSLVVCLLI